MIKPDNEFNRENALILVETLLKEDVKLYNKFLPEIKKFDRVSLYNLLYGNKNYNYEIENKFQFNLLLAKFQNFAVISEDWYNISANHIYLKELWLRYIPIETLTKLEDKQIENFLTKRGITYKSWKQEIKDKFIRLCCNTKDRIISILKEKFEKLPENAKKIFGMVQSISEDCEKAGETAIGVFAFTFAISIIREIADIGKEYIGAISEACKELFSKHKQEHTSNLKSLDSLKKNISKKDIIAKGLSSWLTMLSYGAATLIRLVSSIKTCCEITQTAKQTENFEKEYNKIKKEFETTKKEVDEILSNTSCDPLYNLEKLNICTEKLCVYKQKITYLIFQIKTKLEENEQKRNKEIFNSIISGIETGVGVLGAWVCKGKPKILYTLGAVINGGNTILNGVNIGLSQKNINKLEELLEKSNQLEKDIDQKIEEIKKIFEDTNDQKAFPSF